MPVPQPEEVLELANDLKEARNRVAELESKWERLFTIAAQNVEPLRLPLRPAASFLKPRIVEFLEQRPEIAYTLTQVASALKANENSVSPYLGELVKAGLIERRDRGLYGAKRDEDKEEILLQGQETSPAYQD